MCGPSCAQLGGQRLCAGPLWISDPQAANGCSASLQRTQAAPPQVFVPGIGCMLMFPLMKSRDILSPDIGPGIRTQDSVVTSG